jgi:LysM repeat protein
MIGAIAVIGFFLGILALAILAQVRIAEGAAAATRPGQSQGSAQPSVTTAAPTAPVQPVQPWRPVALEYTVEPGETLAGIAVRYRVPLEQITADNGIADPNRVTAGQHLVLGPAEPGVQVIEPDTTLSGYAQQFGHSVSSLMALNPQLNDPDRIVAGAGLRVAAK